MLGIFDILPWHYFNIYLTSTALNKLFLIHVNKILVMTFFANFSASWLFNRALHDVKAVQGYPIPEEKSSTTKEKPWHSEEANVGQE